MVRSRDEEYPISVDRGGVPISADLIARHVGGRLVGVTEVKITGVAPLDRAERSDLSFLASPKYSEAFSVSRAGVVLVTAALADAPGLPATRIVVEQPHAALLTVIPLLYPAEPRRATVDDTVRIGSGTELGQALTAGPYAVIGSKVRIGDRVILGAHAVVGDGVTIGDDCVVADGAVLCSGTVMGARVVVHSGARLGNDGFGYVQRGGAHVKIPHVGRCVIGDDVEIGANTTIDRGSIDDTVIGEGTKIDNLVHIAHNVRIGRRCLIMAQVGLAGSVRVEDDCTIAGQAGMAGHTTMGRGAILAARGAGISNIPAGETWSGYPARPHRESLRASAALFKLTGMMDRLDELFPEAK